jgi:uncharacterized protein with GYD domain
MSEPVRERAVVREQERAGRVRVEAADGDDALRDVDELDHGRPSLRIPGRRHRARRLVQEHIRESLGRHRLAVDLDQVTGLDERVQPSPPAVHGHTAGLDQLVGAPAGGDARSGEIGVQAHGAYIRRVAHYVTLMRWTTQGYAGLPGWRERIEEGERIIKDAGGSLVGVYVTLGRYDVVEIFEAPDDEVAIEILMKLNRFGAEHTETLRAFTREEAEEIVRKL